MEKRLTQIFATIVALLGILGIFVSGAHLFGLTNADVTMDLARLGLAAVLIYAGFFTDNAVVTKNALIVFGGIYVGLGALGLASNTVWGLLPTGLTGFDIVFHLGAGLIALGAAMRLRVGRPMPHSG